MRLTKLLTVGQVSRKPLSGRCSTSDDKADDGLHWKHQNVVADMQLDERYCLPEDKVALGDLLGKGAFAKVYKCDLDGRAAVCKCIGTGKLDTDTMYLLHNECTIWSRLKHPHIVNFLGMTSTSTGLWLLCEYMPGGSLSEVHERKRSANAPRAAEGDLLDALQQVASGMMYLHALEPPVLHRDLKSPNILISGSRLVIADFGLARYQQADAVRRSLSPSHGSRHRAPSCHHSHLERAHFMPRLSRHRPLGLGSSRLSPSLASRPYSPLALTHHRRR